MNPFPAAIALLVSFLQPVSAGPAFRVYQETAPVLTGRILHANLPVPGATVTIVKDQRAATTTSDGTGTFRFINVEPGVRTIKVEMRGFAPVTRDVTVPLGHPEVGLALTMLKYEEIVDASASAASWPAEAATGGTDPADAPSPQILDGSVINGAASPFAQPLAFGNNRPTAAAPYSGAFTAALGNSAWNARPFSFGRSSAAAPDYANAQLSIAFGGPLRIPGLVRDGPKTRVSYQRGTQHNATTQSARMPTPAERGGDLSAHSGAIRDPLTGDLFSGNFIPTGRIAPQALALLALYPLPTGETGNGANFERPLVGESTSDVLQVQIGWPVSARSLLNGSFGYQRSVSNSVSLFDFSDRSRQSAFTGGLTWTQRIGTRLNLRALYQFTHSKNASTPFFANRVNVSGDAGIAGNDQNPLNWGPPTIAFPDFADLRDSNHQRSSRLSQVVGMELQWRRGSHNLTIGADARLHRLDQLTQSNPRGTLTFTGAATGDAFADFLLGIPTISAIAAGSGTARIRGGSFDAYLNDDFRIRAGLTMDVGLRWEYESPYTERDGRLANLDIASGFGAVATVVGTDPSGPLTGVRYPSSLVQPDRRGFQPRIGLSWRPFLTSTLVVRGGYGLYRNLGVYQSIGTLLAQQPPFTTTVNAENNALTPLTLATPFPVSAPGTATTFAVDPNFRTALLHSWQLSVQRDLPASLTVLVTLFADRGAQLAQAFYPNTVPPGAANPCPGCPSGFVYVTTGGTSTRHAAALMVRRRLHSGFTAGVTYTISKAEDDAATFSNASLAPGTLSVAQNWLDLGAERGPSSFDQRHLVTVDAQYTTGLGVMGGTLVDGWLGKLYKDWTINAQLNAGSGLPVTPLFFAAVPGTGVVGIRPSLTGESIAPIAKDSYANPAAFTAPEPGTWGTAGRHSIRGPSTFSFDLTVARVFRLPRRKTLEWRIAASNVLNRVTFTAIDRVVTSPQFGRPTGVDQMRRIQTLFRIGF